MSTRFTPLGGPLKKGTKGVIFLVCVEKVAHLGGGGGQMLVLDVCVAHLLWPSKKKKGGTF